MPVEQPTLVIIIIPRRPRRTGERTRAGSIRSSRSSTAHIDTIPVSQPKLHSSGSRLCRERERREHEINNFFFRSAVALSFFFRLNLLHLSFFSPSNPPPSLQVEQLDAAGLEAAIASRDKPLIIDFFATWCGPCVLMAKELEVVAAELGDAVRIVKLDVDKEEAIASSLSIQGLPTLVFVGTQPDKPALRTEGLLPAATIKEIIENEL